VTRRLFASSNAIELAREYQQVLPCLPIHADGLRYQLQPQHCQYIYRSDTSTRNHWRQTHQWSASDHRGHLGRIKAEEYRKRCADASGSVCCQRLFPAGKSSGYFEVSLGDAGPSRAGADAERESTMKLASIVRGELAALEEEQHEGAHVFRGFESAKEVSLWARAPHAGRKISRDNASARSPSLERLRPRRASRLCRRYATASSVW